MSENQDSPPSLPRPKGPVFAHPESVMTNRGAKPTPPPLPVPDESVRALRTPIGAAPATPDSGIVPVVGWLVIMAGPGRGRSLSLGLGMNHLGRASSNRQVLDFGDEEISRTTHTTVTFDPRGRKFYVQPGPDAVSLTYLGEGDSARPVLTPTEITGGEIISLGKTHLKFVPFCGSAFSWD